LPGKSDIGLELRSEQEKCGPNQNPFRDLPTHSSESVLESHQSGKSIHDSWCRARCRPESPRAPSSDHAEVSALWLGIAPLRVR